ncbi:MAG: hypothetical protein J0G94_11490 [Sphingomonadales bacterium]|nr:hypothetical protein [Sphingomonadales bacterium]
MSQALEQIGTDLRVIKEEDRLSWKDVGRVLGKSDDRAADYAAAISEMPVSAFLLACREWKGRFANGVLAMIGAKLGDSEADGSSDSERLCRILRLAHLLSVALNDDQTPGDVDEDELREIGSDTLDEAARAIDALRIRLAALHRSPATVTRLSA